MTKAQKPSELAEAAQALDHELRRFEELSGRAARVKLNSAKNLEAATEALSRAAESQDRIQAQVRKLVAAVQAARQKQEVDAAALMARAQEIAARRARFAQVLQRMSGLGQMAKEVQGLLREGPGKLGEVEERMQRVADDAADVGREAQEQEMEDVARQAEELRQQILAAKNKVALLARKGGA
jgi:predicted  nucleic acid-binding Zn-ribbon protein